MIVTYHEMRMWARWLEYFTASEMAEALGTPIEVGEQACRAVINNGIVREIGTIEERGLEAPLFEYIPPPPGPSEHETKPPEWITAPREFGMEIFNTRGLPVRLVDKTKERNIASVPGNRHKIRLRNKRYETMQRAKETRRAKALEGRRNGHPGPEWEG